jgi:peptide-methionine (R)-S-oxide reductase
LVRDTRDALYPAAANSPYYDDEQGILGHRPPGRVTSSRGEDDMDKTYPVTRTDAEWRKLLTAEQYQVMRRHGTEAPGSCALLSEKRAGTFSCAGCGQPLFASATKFESGTGWPSFNDPIEGALETTEDRSYGMVRTEVHCANCGSHMGHVFPDGPPPTHQRYCINGVAINFAPAGEGKRQG